MNMHTIFKLGDEIEGYCSGYFGRDSYGRKTCVMVTPRYAVFEENESGRADVLNYSEDLSKYAAEWRLDMESR